MIVETVVWMNVRGEGRFVVDTLYAIKIRFWQEILKILQKHSGMLE